MASSDSNPQPPAGPFLDIRDQGLAHLRFDDPSRRANVLSEEVMRELARCLGKIREGVAAGRIRGLIISSGKPDGFIAGADVDAIAEVESPVEGAEAARLGQAIYHDLEALAIPTVAAIHGACAGGGLELSLACRYRVASDHRKTRMGLPEVQLGILPAWGGTTRLPRLIGLQAALDMLLTGRLVDARKARRSGLVDAVLPSEFFLEAATDFLMDRLEEHTPFPSRSGPPPSGLLGGHRPRAARIVLAKAPLLGDGEDSG